MLIVGRAEAVHAAARLLATDGAVLASLAFVGEAGIGKTVALAMAVESALTVGAQVLVTRGSESEAQLGFAGLGDLIDTVPPEVIAGLPEPQRYALDVALLRIEPGHQPVDPRAIGMGLTSVLAEMARASQVVLAIDDLPWLDAPTARALHFALRRLTDSNLRLLVTARTGQAPLRPDPTEAVPVDHRRQHTLGPLAVNDLVALARSRTDRSLSRATATRIARAARGNPLCAIELARMIEGQEPSVDDVLSLPEQLQALFRARVGHLPPPTLEALVCLAAVARPRIDLVDQAALVPAERAGLVSLAANGTITFEHPLLAAAVYAGATSALRREIHQRLAAVSPDLEERAQHLGLAVGGSDAAAAQVATAAMRQASQRGAPDSAAALAELAARLTPEHDATSRIQLLLQAARFHLVAGDTVRAGQVVEEILKQTQDPGLRAQGLRLASEVAGYRHGVSASLALVEEAITLATAAGDLTLRAQLRTHRGTMLAAAARWPDSYAELTLALSDADASGDQVLVVQVSAFRAGIGAILGVTADRATLERALAVEPRDRTLPVLMDLRTLVALAMLWSEDPEQACAVLEPLAREAAASGEEGAETVATAQLALASWVAGRFDDAHRQAAQAHFLATRADVDVYTVRSGWLMGLVAAQRGDLAAGVQAADEALTLARKIGWPLGIHEASGVRGMIQMLADDPEGAIDWFGDVLNRVEEAGVHHRNLAMAVPDAIEALVLTGDLDRAEHHTGALLAFGERSGYPWPRAVGRRCRAILLAAGGDLSAAVAAASEAVAIHDTAGNGYETARTLLVLGRAQRRAGARRAARQSLSRARHTFAGAGLIPWVGSVDAELARLATRRAPGTLTPTESLVATLAAEGLSNPEIAHRLFISRRTVEANLSRAYRKLSITNRSQLADHLPPTVNPGPGPC